MPGTDMPQHPTAVHRILHQAHALLTAFENSENDQALPLAELLTRAADHVLAEERERLEPPALARAVAEAAAQLLARCRIPIMAADHNVPHCLQALDRLPRAARTGLLSAAIRYTAPEFHIVPPPDTRPNAPGGQTPARDRSARPCPCPCSSGGFCGGCGHAGCGGRR
ncbi:hypothetical protein ACWDBP_00240 [Streptomyces sp. NPDC001233]|uniref:hypothetical protein n=1 Tax=Streptomyces sp. NPDC001127 TaxID=3154377 RepID=UPI00332914CF